MVSVRRGAARRGGAGGWATCAGDADSVPAGAAGDERGGARPRPVRCAFLGACLSPASAAGRNGRASLVASELGRPLDNQAVAPCAWGWFLLHPLCVPRCFCLPHRCCTLAAPVDVPRRASTFTLLSWTAAAGGSLVWPVHMLIRRHFGLGGGFPGCDTARSSKKDRSGREGDGERGGSVRAEHPLREEAGQCGHEIVLVDLDGRGSWRKLSCLCSTAGSAHILGSLRTQRIRR